MSTGNTQHTKRNILKRMQKIAVKLLNLEHIGQLDPIILLFIQSLAEEVYKSAREIDNIESRIIEKLSDALVIDTLSSTFPAHAILQATPLSNEFSLTPETEFVCNNTKDEKADKLKFNPVCGTIVREGRIRYQIINGVFYEIDPDSSRETISYSRELESLHPNTCWIGLEISFSIENLENLSFYFDFESADDKEKYLKLLPYTLWMLNGNPVNMEQGLYHIPQTFKNRYVELFSTTDIEPSFHINNQIMSYYQHHFLTVSDVMLTNGNKQTFPEQLKRYYPEFAANECNRELIWLEIRFPPIFNKSILEQMRISINAFPISNKYLYEAIAYANEISPIIPLKTNNDEIFISIYSVSDSQGNEYYELPFSDTSDQQYKTYSLRKSGIERYDERDAKKSLSQLANQIENQIAFYSHQTDGNDTSKEAKRQIHLLSAYLRQLVRSYTDKRTSGTYLIIDQLQDDEFIFVKYWITNSELANNIPLHTLMECPQQKEFVASTIRLQTNTCGGKTSTSSILNNSIYHRSLTSRTLLVTNNDIKKYCLNEFNDIVQNVHIHLGYMQCDSLDNAFLQTTDVYVTLRNLTDKLFYQKITSHIYQKLKNNSPAIFNYRVFIQEQDNQTRKQYSDEP